ncbi:hypothetical protein QBC46DRAFT_117360 [Diplogelasinospora grovesii]|uniref:F-box domain-containing protein n=1 Tax=Diplogelasinospora grovesii TaxID=303347 RepID=A0AAN6SA39_9PEZI|nr:hypothetical protein QBC46DRAFT_117360 [Diplogelasinospora grovesii]
MVNPSEDPNPELKSFREQWRAEVRARKPTTATGSSSQQQEQQQHTVAGPSRPPGRRRTSTAEPVRKSALGKKPAVQDHDEDHVQPQKAFDEPAVASTAPGEDDVPGSSDGREPVSALEHYEKAVEKEAVGNLGDSLALYRKAFRMDDKVDQKYKAKHFPRPAPHPPHKHAPSTSVGFGSKTAAAAAEPEKLSMKDLIASFAGLVIEPAEPPVEGMEPPPCPIASLPDEILVHILRDVALLDVGDFVQLAQVCKRLAYLVSTEDRIWRRICLGPEFGFGGMHYHWQRQVEWGSLTSEDLLRELPPAEEEEEDTLVLPTLKTSRAQRERRHSEEKADNTALLFRTVYGSSWQRMFRLRPRIRFNGCYISTVNYVRAGQASANLITWNSPVHIVTYYRYLRFFRDGTVLSLLTTHEPGDVVYHFTKDNAALHAGGANAHLPSHALRDTLKGRWRLLADKKDVEGGEGAEGGEGVVEEGDVCVETEGVSRYIYRLDLTLASGSKASGTKNNRLMWRGHYSYNRLTDDWAEFPLNVKKPFIFSRVTSYGVGE